MANAYATNFPIPSTTNVFQVIWKLSRVMKAAGWTYKASGNGTTKDTSGTASNDLWGGNANPLLDSYSSVASGSGDTAGMWWCASGPQTIKVPLTAAPTGTPVRGEIVTQATSGATGELWGYVFDSVSVSGWAVIGLQTGTFDSSHTITGGVSGATFTPGGTVVTYNREIVIGKPASNTTQGTVYYVCADASAENASLFSVLATSAGCTATVWPGGGGTSNSFPSIAIAFRGTGGAITGFDYWFGGNNTYMTNGNAQIGCANAIASSGTTADGSFYVAASTSTVGLMAGCMFTRVDDAEPGDVDPYCWVGPCGQTFTAYSRTACTSYQNGIPFWQLTNLIGSAYPAFLCYQARGVTTASRDVAMGYTGAFARDVFSSGGYLIYLNNSAAIHTLCTPATSTPTMREPILVYTNGAATGTSRHIKGRCRWLMGVGQGVALDTFDSKNWLVVGSLASNVPAILIGPYDGSTVPAA